MLTYDTAAAALAVARDFAAALGGKPGAAPMGSNFVPTLTLRGITRPV